MKFEKYLSILLMVFSLLALYLVSLHNYLLFHSVVEIFSIVVAFGIFIVAWNSRALLDNHYLLFIGIAYLFVGAVDLVHTLAYKGMGVFKGQETNLATQFWIGARYLESLSLLFAPFFIKRRLKVGREFLGYMIIISFLFISIFYWRLFPVCFIEGVGLTPFKKISEYIISLILVASLMLLNQKREEFDTGVFRLLVLSILFTIASELSFTFYIHAYGFSNLVGHLFKVISFYLIYKALVETGLTKPYNLLFRNLKKSEEELRKAHDELEIRVQERTAELAKVNRALRTLSECNQVIVRARQEPKLLQEMCQTIVEIGGYRLAWIGFVEKDKEKTIHLVAKAGFKEEYEDLTCLDNKKDNDPTGLAIRTGNSVIAKNILNDPAFRNLRKGAVKYGYSSSVALPLITDGQSIGVLGIHAKGPDAFDTDEMKLLEELSNDLTYGILALRTQTERKRAEETLRQSEERYRTLAETAEDVIFILDPEGHFQYINQFGAIQLESDPEKILGKTLPQLFPPEAAEKQMLALKTVVESRKPFFQEINIALPTGDIYSDVRLIPVFAEGKEVQSVMGIARDITERKLAEKALRQAEEKYRDIVENAVEGIFQTTPEGRFISANPALARIHGFDSPEELISSTIAMGHETFVDRNRRAEFARSLRTQGTIQNFEAQVYRKDGSPIWVLMNTRARRNSEGKLLYYEGTVQDITERKQAVEALKKSEHKYRNLIDTARDVIFTLSLNGTILSLNPVFEELVGWSRTKWVGKSFVPLVHPGDAPLALKMFEIALQGETTPLFELRISTRQGEYITGELIAVPQLEGGKMVSVLGIARDITERKRAEEQLKKSEARLRLQIDRMPIGCITWDSKFRVVSWNPTAEKIFGFSEDEALGKHPYDLIVPKDTQPHVDTILRRLLEGDTSAHSLNKNITKDGRTIICDWTNTPLKETDGKVVGVLSMAQDITERIRSEEEAKALQEQLRLSQKMEAIGQLAGGIAHDFNNILTIIGGYIQFSLMELEQGSPLRPNIEGIQRAAERAANLTRQILAFSRRQLMEMRVLDLNTLLQDLDKMLRRVIGEDIHLVTTLSESLGRIKADPGQIEQVILNLAVNARDAMPKGGNLTIETANVELDQIYARNHVAVKPGRYVMLSVSDTGVGMIPEVKDRVFEPFFTTKDKGKGTGLGLSTVYGIVKQSGGNIWVYSEPNHGTTFKIYLPLADEALEENKVEVMAEALPRGDETVLVVEDDEVVRKLIVQILKRQGYNLLEAGDGKDALQICEQHKGTAHLVVTDVVLPGMNGREVADHLLSLCPGMKVLYMSGYTDNAIAYHGVLERGVNYIQKPFTLEGMARKVRQILDSPHKG
jgi:two-component system cell cycle sensor histidine kinase/response regulator CckA